MPESIALHSLDPGMRRDDEKRINQKFVNTPPAKGGGFGLRLKAGSIGRAADYDRRLG